MKIKPLKLLHLIDLISEHNRSRCLQLYYDNEAIFLQAPGSKTKHQAWPGGYIDHLEETMNFALQLYEMMSSHRPLPFTISDALLVLFLHDIEKPFKYCGNVPGLKTDEAKEHFLIFSIISPYHFGLSKDHLNALKFAHGEGIHYHPTERVQQPLGAFIHMCDVASARIWYDYPKQEEVLKEVK